MGKLVVVVGGQYGSEAKGAVVAHLTRTEPSSSPLVVRVGGPNAGHTVYDDEGRRWPLRQIPVGVVRPDTALLIGAGSVIDPNVLSQEVDDLELAGHEVMPRLYIDTGATLLEPEHLEHEQSSGITDRIGSTGKGIGMARAGRIMRTAKTAQHLRNQADLFKAIYVTTASMMTAALYQGRTVIIEGTQGFALGLHRGWYPYATSQDCTAVDVLAQAQLSPWANAVTEFEVWIVFRTYPIRVAGHSGPLWSEISWDELSKRTDGYIQPERTTVTKKVRRVGEWDIELAKQALAANGGATNPAVHLALMMTDYLDPRFANQTKETDELSGAVYTMERELRHGFELLGTGPQSIVDRRSL